MNNFKQSSFDKKLAKFERVAINSANKFIKNGGSIIDKSYNTCYSSFYNSWKDVYLPNQACIIGVIARIKNPKSNLGLINSIAKYFHLSNKDIKNIVYGFDNQFGNKSRSKAYKLGQDLRKKFIHE